MITNTDKPITVLSNTARVNIGETWASILTTWGAEIRTWGDMASLIDNSSLVGSGFLWSVKRFPWLEATPWLTEGGMTNQSKPI